MNEALIQELVERARAASLRSYSPYSNYRVGAALLTEDGQVFSGANIENASYGATLCAEQAAVATMLGAGAQRISAVAVYVQSDDPAAPCGICRQVIAEFSQDALVVCASPSRRIVTRMSELLPRPFKLA
jgi:cytidine deaminase